MRTLLTTLLQIFCKIISNSEVIVKNYKDPDDNFDNEWVRKIIEGEMFIRTLPTTLLQIFCKILSNSKVIVKDTKDPDDNFDNEWVKAHGQVSEDQWSAPRL